MKIGLNLNSSNINFQKRLVANCSFRKGGQTVPAKVYEFDSDDKDDIRYFNSLPMSNDWARNNFLIDVASDLQVGVGSRIYALEDENNRCLAVAEVEDRTKDSSDLVFIETAPSVAWEMYDRNIKYVGETMLATLVKLAKKDKKKQFNVIDPTPYALRFYLKYGFREDVFSEDITIKNSQFEDLIKTNETHTSKIELIG